MALARLLYHEPAFGVLDEATSAVSSDVEGLLYERAKERGITLVTISTRVSLKRFHVFNLRLGAAGGGEKAQGDGDGSGEDDDNDNDNDSDYEGGLAEWSFDCIGTEEEMVGVEREVGALRARLGMVPAWERRLGEVERELGRVWVSSGLGPGEALPAPRYLGEGDGAEGMGEMGDLVR